jgi:uncharacterized membrane protein
MKKLSLVSILLSLFSFLSLSLAFPVKAEWKSWNDILDVKAEEVSILGVSMDTEQLKSFIKTAIIVATSLLVLVLVVVIGYGGILRVTAGDSEEKLQKASKIVKSGVIGVLITFGFLVLFGILAALMGVDITDFSFLDTLL